MVVYRIYGESYIIRTLLLCHSHRLTLDCYFNVMFATLTMFKHDDLQTPITQKHSQKEGGKQLLPIIYYYGGP